MECPSVDVVGGGCGCGDVMEVVEVAVVAVIQAVTSAAAAAAGVCHSNYNQVHTSLVTMQMHLQSSQLVQVDPPYRDIFVLFLSFSFSSNWDLLNGRLLA